MTFNWILEGLPNPAQLKTCIELEYQLRPRITRFLMDRLGPEYLGDFSDFHFDVDLVSREVRISDKTPAAYIAGLSMDFMNEIGRGCC
ncbi:hypothetical protein OZ410_07690 [Robiginitalea sp. M366]|uniref:hypothetical protein n=1 Tax=Robiginitalea aestuariiviva TaxID=3036903 RepID=UPI00240D4B0F|nr:hypothetical protein [Robiginitalea aestuariiviva]MDG1572194.1 hypothetical protein [Robiginitalea aestuariiviva]